MTSFRTRFKILFVFSIFFLSSPLLFAAVGKKAMIVTAHPIATEIAYQALEQGGNAVDAAIAAQWVLNVVEPQSSGIGGGGFFLYFEAKTRRFYIFDGREAAPAEAHPEMFLNPQGVPYSFEEASTSGIAVGVPGTLKLLKQVHEKIGSKTFGFSELFEPAVQIAENGFPISPRLASFIESQKDRLARFEASRKIFMDEKGNPLKVGQMLIQKDLAETFRLIQKEGIHVFYEGEIARDIVDCVRQAPHPGAMKMDDLLFYKVFERDPVVGRYHGYDIFSMPPPSSGGTTLIETLNILERFNLSSMNKADFIHVFSEAQKLAFKDRNFYLGDPAYSQIPVEKLLSKEHAAGLSKMIQMDKVIEPKPEAMAGAHTSHLSIVDEEGNMVAFTTTIEHIFGTAMVVPGRGFFLNNELTDFDAAPKREDGALKANAPEGEKRPRSSMTPAFVFKNGLPVMIVGSPGGSTIISTVLNIIVNVVDLGMPLHEAVSAPRILNRDGPLELEQAIFDNEVLKEELRNKGHEVILNPRIGNAQAVYFDHGRDEITGISDPRGEGEAMGY